MTPNKKFNQLWNAENFWETSDSFSSDFVHKEEVGVTFHKTTFNNGTLEVSANFGDSWNPAWTVSFSPKDNTFHFTNTTEKQFNSTVDWVFSQGEFLVNEFDEDLDSVYDEAYKADLLMNVQNGH